MTKEEAIEILERFVLGAKPCSQREIIDACASAYGMLKEQPSLPSNLDEAAEEYANSLSYYNYENDDPAIAFKAGAEWMAGQGETFEDTVFVNAMGESYLGDGTYLTEKIPEGTKVIVQVRKKYL